MTSEMIFLNDEERMSKTDLEGIIGGRKKIKVSCKLEITICYVEVNDTLKAK